MSFITRFEAQFKRLFGIAPSWIHVGQSIVAFSVPVVKLMMLQLDPADVPEATAIMSEVQADLATASVLIGDGKATPSLTDALNRFSTNLGSLLQAGHIKDPKLQADITLVTGEVNALVDQLPTTTPALPAPQQIQATTEPPQIEPPQIELTPQSEPPQETPAEGTAAPTAL